MDPVTREEMYLAKAAGEYSGDVPEPITRKEMYLNAIAENGGGGGTAGADGKSAYEIAVENGFEGTEEEWLESLNGADGEDGKTAYEYAVDGGYEGTESEFAALMATNYMFKDLDTLTPIQTIEYDVSDTSYHPILTRPAVTSYSDETMPLNDTAYFRITITGGTEGTSTEIYTKWDCYLEFQEYPIQAPRLYIYKGGTKTASTTYSGLRYIRALYQKGVGSSYADYPFAVEICAYNATARHIKIEVFETSDNITWMEELTDTIYNSSYHTVTSMTTSSGQPPFITGTTYVTANSASSASYVSQYLHKGIGATLTAPGEAIAQYSLMFRGTDLKYYLASNTSQPVDVAYGIDVTSTALSSGSTPTATYARQRYVATLASSTTPTKTGTQALGQNVWLRFHRDDDGLVYSDSVLFSGQMSDLEGGYIWYLVGRWNNASSNSCLVDTVNSHFIELDADGNIIGYDGLRFA